LSLSSAAAAASPTDELQAAFAKFVAAQNAHDIRAVADLLRSGPEFVWVTRGNVIWGREKALERFATLYAGTWELKTDPAAVRIVFISSTVAQLLAPIKFRIGPPGQPAADADFIMTQAWIHESDGWKISSLLPIPASPMPSPSKP
jgi:ketosteroid isomerase-like protein